MSNPPTVFRPLWPLVFGFALLLVAVIATAWISLEQQRTSLAVRTALLTENELNRVSTLVTDAEMGQRGYLLTGRDSYLEPYLIAKQELLNEIDNLSTLIRGEGGPESHVSALRRLAADKLSELESTISARRAGKTDEALAIVNGDSGYRLMTGIRDTIAALRAREQKGLEDSTAFAENLRFLSVVGLAIATILVLIIAVATVRDGRRRLAELAATNKKLEAETIERKQATSQVRQLQKMEAVGQLTSGIAHDFNNMLAIVIGSLDVARRRLSGAENPTVLQCINNAAEGAERASVLTARLLAFSRQQPLDPKVLDMNKLVSGMSQLLRRTIGEPVEIETVLAGGLWRTFADPAQVESTVLNLAVNARDAMPDGGKLTIETANAYLDEAYAADHPEVTAGQYAMISVTDTGIGMSAEVIERAFDPFYTTKGPGKGTGLGLSQVFGFVRQSGGHVKIYSEVDHGTTVKVYLPRYEGQTTETVAAQEPSALPLGQPLEIVLVVEDEEKVRHVTVDALRELGYTVVEAGSPSDALQQLTANPKIALLLTDIVMPEMNGRNLAERALELKPGLKVIYTTGYTRNAVVHNGILDAGVAFLPKPFSIEQLANKVRQVLDS
ncbi:MAG TPA: CHASE3 domain-containing protein [Gemmataceae bacterium]|nr:CHASE3 domain-containing protein [Gemmataceae bacterium]